MLISLILIGAVAIALHLVFLTKELQKDAQFSPLFAMGITHLLSGIALTPIWLSTEKVASLSASITQDFLCFLLIAVLTTLISKALYLYAYTKEKTSSVATFSSLTPIITILTGWVFLNEMPATTAITGIFIICIAIYLMLFAKNAEAFSLRTLLQPFQAAFTSMPIMCALLSTVPIAISVVFQKKAILELDPLSYVLIATYTLGITSLAIDWIRRPSVSFKSKVSNVSFWCILSAALFLAVFQITSSITLVYEKAASIIALQRISIPLQVLFAYYILNQRANIAKDIILTLILLGGFYLIAMDANHPPASLKDALSLTPTATNSTMN